MNWKKNTCLAVALLALFVVIFMVPMEQDTEIIVASFAFALFCLLLGSLVVSSVRLIKEKRSERKRARRRQRREIRRLQKARSQFAEPTLSSSES